MGERKRTEDYNNMPVFTQLFLRISEINSQNIRSMVYIIYMGDMGRQLFQNSEDDCRFCNFVLSNC